MANLQFFLIAASFWVLLVIPRSRAGRGLSVVFLIATAASTIVGFVLFPVALLRLLDRRDRLPALVFLAVEALHGILILIAAPTRKLEAFPSLHNVVHHFVYDVVVSQFFGGPFSENHYQHLTLAVAGVAAVASIVLLLVTRPADARSELIVAVGTMILGGVTYLLEATTDNTAPRYAVLPALFILFGVGIVADVALRVNAAKTIAGLIALAVVLSWGLSFPVTSYREVGPRWSATYADAQRACHRLTGVERLPILPVGWTMTLPCNAIQ